MLAKDNIWFYRNQIIHESLNINIDQFVPKVIKSYRDRCNAWEWRTLGNIPFWSPPSRDYLSVYFDVAIRASGSTTTSIGRINSCD